MPNAPKFQNKYRIPSARLTGWDYRTSAPYFITICSKNMIHVFGYIENGSMHLNELGQFTNDCLDNINIYSKHAKVTNQIVMPNHVHIIIELENNTLNYQPNTFGPLLSKSISSVINHFKGRVTKYARQNEIAFSWQPLFHDHIIRDSEEYIRIFNYITKNPQKWDDDKFGSKKKIE